MTRYWIGVASKSHVQRGVDGSFGQLNHGKKAPLQKLKANDCLIFYLPRLELESKEPCQRFTAIGRVSTGEVYQHDMGIGFVPYRVDAVVDEAVSQSGTISPTRRCYHVTQPNAARSARGLFRC
jgi:hypothetical protein